MVAGMSERRGCVIGIDLGGTYMRLQVADAVGQALSERRIRSDAAKGGEDLFATLVDAIDASIREAGGDFAALRSIAIGTPSVVDPASGRQHNTVNLPGWDGVDLHGRLCETYGVPVAIENDVNLAALGELECGAGRGYQDFVLIHVGTGVGAAVVVGRSLVRGKGGAAGEIAWMLLDREATHERFRASGFLESVASGSGMRTQAEALLAEVAGSSVARGREQDAAALFDAYRRGDPLARRVIDQAIKYLGFAAVNATALLAPEAVILGGGVIAKQPFIVDEIERIVHERAVVPPDVVRAELGEASGLRGAVIRALEVMRSTG